MSLTIATTNPDGHIRPVRVGGATRRHRDHSMLFYEDDDYLLDELAWESGAALEAGVSVVILATAVHRDGLERRLRRDGWNLAAAKESGRYVSLDAVTVLDTLLRDGRIDPEAFHERLGGAVRGAILKSDAGAGCFVFGELVVLPLAADRADLSLELEARWNELMAELEFTLLCAYPLAAFGTAAGCGVMTEICTAHAGVIPAESFAALPTEQERMREIALLQQKSRALSAEIAANERTRQSLATSEDEARRAVDARDTFLWAAAHDFRTPITSIRGYAQLLLRTARQGKPVDTGRLDAALAAIDQQTTKLTLLIDRLLETMGGPEPILRVERMSTDMAALLRDVLARQPLPARHRIVLECPASLSGWVDPARFEQLVAILLDNAIRYNPGGGDITIALAGDDHGDIRLMIEDGGVGIPVAEREAIFQRHRPASSGQHLAGMGLGLFVARQIVHRHGGSIYAEEPEHPGARFVVQLPAVAPAA